ncbi:MAG: methylmalonyl Co-A mutase-associated GTPase MeaB [Myxococcales bacterium]|nr:methylmalonyl Co-A mutase-associated GTPase MeaB [Myxococcales bacterium]
MRDIDDRQPHVTAALKQLYRASSGAYIVGITGNPGAGKSTVVDALISFYRARGERVAVIAVDPTSPFTGGAILGDRIRMNRHALDAGVFIRSLATRGHMGGLSRATFDVAVVLDAMKYDRILIETVGVGQDEVDVMRAAHTSVVVTVPGLGDDIQAIKAGILEIADVLAINKADREGAERTERDLLHMLDLRAPGERKDVEIIKTIASKGLSEGSGVAQLAAAIDAHRDLQNASPARREQRAAQHALAHVRELIRAGLAQRVEQLFAEQGTIAEATARLAAHRDDPYGVAEAALATLMPPASGA